MRVGVVPVMSPAGLRLLPGTQEVLGDCLLGSGSFRKGEGALPMGRPEGRAYSLALGWVSLMLP